MRLPTLFNSIQGKGYLFFALAAWVYVLLRAIYVPIVYDEAVTFYSFIQTGDFLPPNAQWSANNHLLNSILSFICYKIFGSELWSLRLPNVLSFGLYLFFVWKIAQFTSSIWRRLSLISGLVFIHFVLDFFSITRGYGMSLAFMLGSVWCTMSLFNQLSKSRVIGALLFAILASAANLTLLITGLSIWGVVILLLIVRYRQNQVKFSKRFLWIPLFVLGLLLWGFLVFFSMELKNRNQLYYGGEDGFVNDTIGSLVGNIFSDSVPFLNYVVAGIGLIVFALYFIDHFRNKRKWNIAPKHLPTLFLFINCAAIVSMHHILGLKFPIDRTTMHLLVFFVLAISFVPVLIRGIEIVAMLPILFIFQLPLKANFTHVELWRQQRIPKDYFKNVGQWQIKNNRKATIGGSPELWLPWSFVNLQKGHKFNHLWHDEFPEPTADFQIVDLNADLDYWLENYEEINHDNHSGLSLLQRKELVDVTPVSRNSVDPVENLKNEFIMLRKDSISLPESTFLRAHVKVNVTSMSSPNLAWVVVTVRDEKGEVQAYKHIQFNWLSTDWNSEEFDQTYSIPDLPAGEKMLSIYIWNLEHQTISLNSGSVEVGFVKKPAQFDD